MSTPPTQGFSLRRDVYTDIPSLLNTLLKVEEWALVLPQRRDIHQVRIPWSDFFDLQSLNRNIPVTEYKQFTAGLPFTQYRGELSHRCWNTEPPLPSWSRGRSCLKIKWKRPSVESPPEEVGPRDCLCLRAVQTGAGVPERAREVCGAAPQLTWVTGMVTQSPGCSEAPAGPSRRRRTRVHDGFKVWLAVISLQSNNLILAEYLEKTLKTPYN